MPSQHTKLCSLQYVHFHGPGGLNFGFAYSISLVNLVNNTIACLSPPLQESSHSLFYDTGLRFTTSLHFVTYTAFHSGSSRKFFEILVVITNRTPLWYVWSIHFICSSHGNFRRCWSAHPGDLNRVYKTQELTAWIYPSFSLHQLH